MEFIRFCIVGGLSFCADFGTLILLRWYVFPEEDIWVYVATFFAFLVGLGVNTVLAIKFVFRNVDVMQARRGKSKKDLLRIFAIGMTGLSLTELGMFVGVYLLSQHYVLTKLVVTFIVMFWNYFARKIFVFRAGK